jgi:hypothetical protein
MACAFFNAATLENPSRMGHPKFKTKAGPSATLSSQSVKACFARRMAPPALGVILSEAKNLSVTVLAVRKTAERFFASLRMTASGAGAHRALNGLRFYHCPYP